MKYILLLILSFPVFAQSLKVSQMQSLSASAIATDDLMMIIDTSAGTSGSKKIRIDELDTRWAPPSGTGFVTVVGGVQSTQASINYTDVSGSSINALAGFDSSGTLYALPTYSFIPYIDGIASSMTTDGSSNTNVEKLYFGTTFGNGVTGDIDNYTDLYFNNITNANFNIDYYRSLASYFNAANSPIIGQVSIVDTGFGGNVTNDVKLFSSYYQGDNGGSYYGVNISKDGNTTGNSISFNASTTGQAVNVTGVRTTNGGSVSNQVEHFSSYNNGPITGNYFGLNDSNNAPVGGGIYHVNGSNQGSANFYTGVSLGNSAPIATYLNAFNFNNQSTGIVPSLTFYNAGNDANISGNFTGVNLTNQGTSTNNTGVAVSNGASASAVNYQGLSISQQADISGSSTIINVSNTGDGVQTTGLNINIDGNHTTSLIGASISVSNATHPNTIQPIGLSLNGALNANSSLITGTDPVGISSSLNSIGGLFRVASGSALSGGEFLFGNNLAPVMDFKDNMGEDLTGLDLGFVPVGFVGSLSVDAGKQVNDINMALAGAGNPSGSGVVDNLTMFYGAGLLPQGGSVTVNNMYAFKSSTVLCAVAGNCWGLYIPDTTAENYIERLAFGTANKKVSSSDAAIEIGNKKVIALGKDTTAELNAMSVTEGSIAYNTTTQKPSYYNGTSWQDIGTGVGSSGVTTSGIVADNGMTVFQGSTGATIRQASGSGFVKLSSGIVTTQAAITETDISITGTGFVKTSGGAITTSASIAAGSELSGIVPLANGGTNKAGAASSGAIVYSDADSYELLSCAAGQYVQMQGSSAPTCATITTSAGITGPASTSDGAIALWNGTAGSAIKQLGFGTTGQILTTSGSSVVWATNSSSIGKICSATVDSAGNVSNEICNGAADTSFITGSCTTSSPTTTCTITGYTVTPNCVANPTYPGSGAPLSVYEAKATSSTSFRVNGYDFTNATTILVPFIVICQGY